jgi:hypothetical protein
MSVRKQAEVWSFSKQTGTALLMMLALADHANDDGVCWPGVERLAKMCRIGPRQAQRLIHELVDAGEVQIVREGGGKGHTNLYRVTPPTGFGEPETATDRGASVTGFVPERVSSGASNPVTGDTNPVIQRAKGDIALSGEPSLSTTVIEPSEEPRHSENNEWITCRRCGGKYRKEHAGSFVGENCLAHSGTARGATRPTTVQDLAAADAAHARHR